MQCTKIIYGLLSLLLIPQITYAKPFIIGIAGGSGSGKSTLAKNLSELIDKQTLLRVMILDGDSYFDYSLQPSSDYCHDPAYDFYTDDHPYDYDNPSALDLNSLLNDLLILRDGKVIQLRKFDPIEIKLGNKKCLTNSIQSPDIIITESIHMFYKDEIVNLLNFKVFVDINEETQKERRILRDIKRFSSSRENEEKLYNIMVYPNYIKFIKPKKEIADFIVTDENEQNASHRILNIILEKLKTFQKYEVNKILSKSIDVS